MGDIEENKLYDDVYENHISYLENYFKIIKVEYYNSDDSANNLSFSLNTFGKNYKKNTNVVLASYQVNYPSISKYNNFSKNLRRPANTSSVFGAGFCWLSNCSILSVNGLEEVECPIHLRAES